MAIVQHYRPIFRHLDQLAGVGYLLADAVERLFAVGVLDNRIGLARTDL